MEKKHERILNNKILKRLLIISNFIKSGAYPNNEKLREYYEEKTENSVSEATIARDIRDLKDFYGAPIEFDRSKNGYYFCDKNWQFALVPSSPDEIFYLSAAKSILSCFDGSPLYKTVFDAIDFLTSACGDKNTLLNRIAIPPKPKPQIDEKIWSKIIFAVKENKILEFDYKGISSGIFKKRRVYPYQILLDDGLYFIYGFAEEKKDTRLFCLSRMKNVIVTNKDFPLPDNFDFSAKCSGGKFGAYSSEESEEYIIDFYAESRLVVKERIWAENQKITDYDEYDCTEIQFSSVQFGKILEWLLSQGGNARPISPPYLVDCWKEHIQMMVENSATV